MNIQKRSETKKSRRKIRRINQRKPAGKAKGIPKESNRKTKANNRKLNENSRKTW